MRKGSRCTAFILLLSLMLVTARHWSLDGGRAVLAEASYPTVILDAGHGGEDGGAVGVTGVLEKDLNLNLTFALADLLRDAGVSVVLTRESDRMLYEQGQDVPGKRKYYDLRNRLAYAERDPSALFVSIHMNSYPNGAYYGFQAWCASNPESLSLAETVSASVRERLQPDNRRRVKTADGNLFLLSRAPGRAVLLECGFLSNQNECERLCDEDYRRELSFAIFCGIMNYLNANPGEK